MSGPIVLPFVTTYDDKGAKTATLSLSSLVKSYASVGVASGLVVKGLKSSITAASNLQETVGKVNVVFGKSASSIESFAKTASTTFGQSKQQAMDAAATFAVFGKSAGLAGNDLVKFSTEFVTLASDMASFSNTTPEEAIQSLGAALRGESEPIRKYGVLLDDATLKARASTMGIYKGTGALTAQQKVLAAQAEIMNQTQLAQGDFARTQDGLANSTRTLNAQLSDLSSTVGSKLLPVVTDYTKAASKIAQATIGAEGKTAGWSNKLFELVTRILPATQQIGFLNAAVKGYADTANGAVKETRNLSRQFRAFEGHMMSAYENGLKPTKEELAALARTQDTARKKAKEYAETLRDRVGTALQTITDKVKSAQDAYNNFRDSQTDSIRGFVSLSDAVKTQKDAEDELSDALKTRAQAYTALSKIDPVTDANDYADALERVAQAESDVASATTKRSKVNYTDVFQKQITDAKHFSEKLQWLVTNQGLGKEGLAQLLNLGPEAGNIVAGNMIDGVDGFVSQTLNQSLADLSASGAALGTTGANAFFGGALSQANAAQGTVNQISINVTAGLVSNPAQVGRDIIEAIKQAERVSGQVFVSAI
jgi:hypothetical protein